jgi:ubiquinone biosynthesis protein COQ9
MDPAGGAAMSALLTQDEALALMLPLVPEHGWSPATLRMALKGAGADPIDAEILFPGGAVELVEEFIACADRAMTTGAADLDLENLRPPQRIVALIGLRLRLMHPHKEAVRRGVAVLAPHPVRAVRSAAATVDTLWHLAGDTSADFSWYTKRATLAGVYTATLLFWLRDQSDDDAPTMAFLERRLARSQNVVKLRRRIEAAMGRCRPAA